MSIKLFVCIASAAAILYTSSCTTATSGSAPSDQKAAMAPDSEKSAPRSAKALVEQASAYINKARYAGDFSLNAKARDSVEQALAIEPNDQSALRLKASLHLTFHEFAEGLALGEQLEAKAGADPFILGVITDAHTQLGNYPKAVETAQKMVDLKPNSQSYSRVAILRGLHGDTNGAAEMFKLAARTADPADKEAQAWTLTQLGDLYWRNGKFDDASKSYDEALSLVADYPNAMFGKGRVMAAKGDFKESFATISGAVERSPHTYSIIQLGDVAMKAGSVDAAQQLYRLADDANALGDTHDAHRIALLWADRDVNLDQALAIAEADYAGLKDIYAADILSWGLFKKGRFAEAREKSREALRIGTKDAVLLYHAGMIENALGNRVEARRLLKSALDLNPAFDLIQAEIAKTTLDKIS